MKKFLFLLLLSGFAFGQNVELLKSINNLDSLSTRELSEKIFEGYKIEPFTEDDYRELKWSSNLIYTLKNSEGKKANVEFQKLTRNANADLNIKGEIYYVFKNTGFNGIFLEMFPFWKKEVQPEASTDKTYESTAVYTYKNKDINVWLNFWRTSKGWMIRNMSDYSQPW